MFNIFLIGPTLWTYIASYIAVLRSPKNILLPERKLICSAFLKVERINGLNEELHDRAVSAELQIQALSDEYRSVIEQKEVYIYIWFL